MTTSMLRIQRISRPAVLFAAVLCGTAMGNTQPMTPAGAPSLVIEAAEHQLRHDLEPLAQRVELTPLLDVGRMAPLDATQTLVARPTSVQRPRERMSVRVDVLAGERFVRQIVVPFEVHVFARVIVPTHDAEPGRVLKAADFDSQERDITSHLSALLRPADVARDWIAIRSLGAGEPVRTDAVVLRRDVMQGERIELKYATGALTVEKIAVAQQDGDTGQVIRVRPSGADATIQARIGGPGWAVLQESKQ